MNARKVDCAPVKQEELMVASADNELSLPRIVYGRGVADVAVDPEV